MSNRNLNKINEQLRDKTPAEIISWGIGHSAKPVITTKFGPRSASILHAVTRIKPDIDVIWIDTGYNTSYTYKFAGQVTNLLNLNLHTYIPHQTVAHRNVLLGLPDIDDPRHGIFTEQVKLEPFRRAMKNHLPDVWFTNLRKGQTAHRDSLDIVSVTGKGVIKIAPFYHFSDAQLDSYLTDNKLPDQPKYYDPTKVLNNRECGLHTQ